MNRSDEPFLSRWSRLKREEARKEDTGAPRHGPENDVQTRGSAGAEAAKRAEREVDRRADTLDDLKSVDIEALDFNSDFGRFMQRGVPDELRNKALRKLWTSDPIFGVMDGLDDYCEDFSDAVWATPDLKTAYKIGRGFLSDEEVLAWENLGKPKKDDTVASDTATANDARETQAPETTEPVLSSDDAASTSTAEDDAVERDMAAGVAESDERT